jgi:sterol desaturase/sphingolipid hydroxylase (fatty acid hydroxylase superfamily)
MTIATGQYAPSLSEDSVLSDLQAFSSTSAVSLWKAIQMLALSAVYFGLLALLVKGTGAIDAAKRARRETSVNLWLFVLDALLIAPFITVVVRIIRLGLSGSPLELVRPESWDSLPVVVTGFAALFVGDFISYWRHRLEHTRLLWPSHAVHHSDTEMTWLTLSRFHPINRLTTMVVDTAFLAVMGFPEWSLVLNVIVRHFYGEFIHADFPWMYGPLGRVMVSPVMHRWHHARDVEGSGSNFATVFSVFDQAFGTYYVPGPCNVPLGVSDQMGGGTTGQLLYPFVEWGGRIATRMRPGRRSKPKPLEPTAPHTAGR